MTEDEDWTDEEVKRFRAIVYTLARQHKALIKWWDGKDGRL